MESLSTKEYKNEFIDQFPGDESGKQHPRQTPGVLYSKTLPTPVRAPKLLAWSDELARDLGIKKPTDAQDINILAGNLVTPSMDPYAARYAGHQFGHWAGQLGDGRAITLGEWETPEGNSVELQLKGAGPTAYSRRADGRAVLRSSVREYLMSEAMHYLGIPTTRALSLVSTGDEVMRDMFYSGNPLYEPGAIVMRTAPSFLRFGSFEMPAAAKETENLQQLADWTIERYYPHITGEDKIIRWFSEITERTADLMAQWMRVGFVHGVMNTDNMSVLGLTIDYGPFSFLDDFDPDFTPNTTDLPGRRYSFGNQPSIGQWNLARLAGAIAPLLENTEPLVAVLEGYEKIFLKKHYTNMGNKLGLDEVKQEDISLIGLFEKTLTLIKPDMTIFYQLLADFTPGTEKMEEVLSHFEAAFYQEPNPEQAEALMSLMKNYSARMQKNTISAEESKKRMQENNPRFILRNYLLHQAIEELEKGEDQLFVKLQQAIKEPFSGKFDEFFARRPAWAEKKAGCSMLSCSS